jgi:hypothetical protein
MRALCQQSAAYATASARLGSVFTAAPASYGRTAR